MTTTIDMRQLLPRMKEHREDIQRALRAARIRPAPKQCFRNAARLVFEQDEIELVYVEGYSNAGSGVVIPHAWVRTADGVDHDITLREGAPVRALLEMSKAEVVAAIRRYGTWGPWFAGSWDDEAERIDGATPAMTGGGWRTR